MKILILLINKLTCLLCIGFIYAPFGCAYKQIFPKNLCNLQLIKLVQGEQAINEVNKLHGKKIPVKNAWIGNYRGEDSNNAMIWISESFNTKEATEQTEVMMKKIEANPKSPFHNLQVKHNLNRKIYTFSGMQQYHAVFRNGKKVFWISASRGIFKEILEYYLRI